MSVFENIIKKFKKDKQSQEELSVVKAKEQPKAIDERFDFEKLESQEKASSTKENKDMQFFNLNSVFWIFIEREKGESMKIEAIPFVFDSINKKFSNVLNGNSFDVVDITKGDALQRTRKESSDVCVFGVRVDNAYNNYRIVGSGEALGITKDDGVSTYNPNSPALLKLFTKSFEKTNFDEILCEGRVGITLKENASVSRKDIEKLNVGIEKTYKEERIEKIDFERSVSAI